MANILITGAAGTIGQEITRYLVKNHTLTLVDHDFSEFPEDLLTQTSYTSTDLIERENWQGLLEDIEYVIQLAGQADAGAEFYGDLLELNYKLPHNLFEEAKQANKLKRIIFASSVHIVDAYPNDIQVKTTDPIRPADLYGVSKAYLEALAAFHAYTNGIESIGIRIADYKAGNEGISEHADEYGLAMFFSRDDMNHLIDCCLKAELKEPFLIINGVSNNTFTRLSNEEARVKVGYDPKDNAFDIIGAFDI